MPMERTELAIQLLKLAMMGAFLTLTVWVISSGGLPCRIVG